jgi:polysaccharide export outer membrane protein
MTNVFLCMALVIISGTSLLGQGRPSVYGPMGDAALTNLPGQKIGPNDLIGISVYDSPELTRTVRVSADGQITLPMLKRKLAAAGNLPSALEAEIAAALKEDGILVDPVVAVTVVEYHSRPISVMGAVRRPTTFQAMGRTTLLEALGRAEGLSEEAGPEILLSRPDPTKAPGQSLVTRIPVRELIDQAKPEWNIVLAGGEDIRVPVARKIYVSGNVKKPLAFPVREGSPVTVMKALAMAEGVSPFYSRQAFIFRPREDGSKEEIPVELTKILKRESADVTLQPEDVLYIPENTRRKTVVNVAEKASGFGLATISGLLIWRR